MTDQLETNETLEVTEANAEASADETEGETATKETQTQPDPKDEEIARLQAELKRKDGRIGQEKGYRLQLTRLVKHQMDEGLMDEEEGAQALNIKPEQLRGILNAPDVADNPTQEQAKAFDALYVNAGVKGTLDEIYGEDTQQYVNAFSRAMAADENLAAEFVDTERTKLPAFVVKKGKEILAKQKSTETLADENARLKAELEALKAGKGEGEAVVEKRKTLPLSGLGASGSMGNRTSLSDVERLFG